MNMLFITLLVVFGSTEPTLDAEGKEQHPGFMQLTVLESFQSSKECLKKIEKLGLSEEQKESVGCIRVLKADKEPREA